MDTPESARRARFHVLQPNRRRMGLLRRQHPGIALEALQYLSADTRMTDQQVERFLQPYSYPELEHGVLARLNSLQDFEAAAARLADAVIAAQSGGKAIGISGDYDCDGNCSTALMVRFLQESGVPSRNIHVHIPNRKIEGYGVNGEAVHAMRDKQVGLLVTLDNGTLAHQPLAKAKALGMDVVVIDHHPNTDGHALPDGALVVNPKRSDEPLRRDADGVADMAAVGVSWLLCRRAAQLLQQRGHYARMGEPASNPRDWLGLVAMATIGDVVNIQSPLNRALVNEGLAVIREGRDPFLAALMRVAQIADITQISEEDIAFKLAPIINAPGRLWQSVAWAFLCPADATSTALEALQQRAQQENELLYDHLASMQRQLGGRFAAENRNHDRAVAAKLGEARTVDVPLAPSNEVSTSQYALMVLSNEANERRKLVETAVLRQARPMAAHHLRQHPSAATLLVAGEGWHEGVIGIVAGKLKEEFSMPAVVASIDRESGLCKASARSIKTPDDAVDIGQAMRDLCEKDGVLLKAGGHPMAAGASFDRSQLEAFRSGLEKKLADAVKHVRQTQRQSLAGVIDLSQAASVADASPVAVLRRMVNAQEALRPYGEGSAKPRIGLHGVRITQINRSRDGRHVFFELGPKVAYSDQWRITGHAFHAAGSALETALLRARSGAEGMEYVLTGTLALNAARQETTLQFRLDDVLAVPIPVSLGGRASRVALARALDCRPDDLMGITAAPGPATQQGAGK